MPWTKVAVEQAQAHWSSDADVSSKRDLTYAQALREALQQALQRDSRVFVMGEGVDDPGGIFGSTLNLHKEFGERVFDVPIAENALTGFATGAALTGMRPVLVHMRMDFVLLSLDQILNHAAKLCYMSDGQACVPLVIRCIIGRGWGSAAQHSQALHALFLHMPGLKIAMPAFAYDAKGLLLASIADNNPVLFVEHRWLYNRKEHMPEEEYLIPFGKGHIRREGKEVTILAVSLMVHEALLAAERLSQDGIQVEVVDPRTLNPFDEDIVAESVIKTGRLVIADLGCKSGGLAEILLGRLHNKIKPHLKSDVGIIALPDAPTPAASVLETAYYPGADSIIKTVKELL